MEYLELLEINSRVNSRNDSINIHDFTAKMHIHIQNIYSFVVVFA